MAKAKTMEKTSKYASYGLGITKALSGMQSAKSQYGMDKYNIGLELTGAEIENVETKKTIAEGLKNAYKQALQGIEVVHATKSTDQVSSSTQSNMFSIGEFVAGEINTARDSARMAELNLEVARTEADVKKKYAKMKKNKAIAGSIISGATDIAKIAMGGV